MSYLEISNDSPTKSTEKPSKALVPNTLSGKKVHHKIFIFFKGVCKQNIYIFGSYEGILYVQSNFRPYISRRKEMYFSEFKKTLFIYLNDKVNQKYTVNSEN